ncbi:hypothetical protein NDU88_004056 [Pleurodeles waltl]|uniref:Uncharacterized protein n=1 Tax=Pleurodeles waltl TaxID=8319 RepID=A0AAV7W7X2_PLEWA|nr:hypothetical protein NDU88_004056 [Pleurodeles waltl]
MGRFPRKLSLGAPGAHFRVRKAPGSLRVTSIPTRKPFWVLQVDQKRTEPRGFLRAPASVLGGNHRPRRRDPGDLPKPHCLGGVTVTGQFPPKLPLGALEAHLRVQKAPGSPLVTSMPTQKPFWVLQADQKRTEPQGFVRAPASVLGENHRPRRRDPGDLPKPSQRNAFS